ncbi:von Willebrand factor A domain-containing 3A [Gossypium arboreum]|uniref:von Willebrand factor A domain-containing 3A n=1 Tax=Gossypium arboreum TaxID=29729 RepID=A0A0B0NNY5_GOSAR|nr:von Willebrand factor A domain-containing 3A [Gossypium arboreum]
MVLHGITDIDADSPAMVLHDVSYRCHVPDIVIHEITYRCQCHIPYMVLHRISYNPNVMTFVS